MSGPGPLNHIMIRQFVKKHANKLLLGAIILGVAVFSLSALTTKPKLWIDEGLTMELARNFMSYGRLDLMVEPGVFSGESFLLQSTGYPMTLPLALIFKVFGVGAVQARWFALSVMLIFLTAVYLFSKKIFGVRYAFLSVLLLATFASFYGSGRCLTGEVMGFIFLLAGLYRLFYKDGAFSGGLFLGLAVAAKPSVYLAAVVAAAVVLLFDRPAGWRRLAEFFAGVALPAGLWVSLTVPDYFRPAAWLEMAGFLKSPFGQTPALANVAANLAAWPRSTTLLYFSGLFLIFLGALIRRKDFFRQHKRFFIFVAVFIFLTAAYFLKSPGWLRYWLAAEFLVFLVLGPAVKAILDGFPAGRFEIIGKNKGKIIWGGLGCLVLMQAAQLNFGAQLFSSTASLDAIDFLNGRPAAESVGLINSVEVGALIRADNKYQRLDTLTGLGVLGQNFLSPQAPVRPDLAVIGAGEIAAGAYQDELAAYQLIYENGKYNIYVRK